MSYRKTAEVESLVVVVVQNRSGEGRRGEEEKLEGRECGRREFRQWTTKRDQLSREEGALK